MGGVARRAEKYASINVDAVLIKLHDHKSYEQQSVASKTKLGLGS